MRDLYTKAIKIYETMSTEDLQDMTYKQMLSYEVCDEKGFSIPAFELALHYMAVSVIQDRSKTNDKINRRPADRN